MRKREGRVPLWLWRRNPLRRRSDVAEAWLGVAAAALLRLAVPTAAVTTAAVAEHSTLDRARGLHRVTAHVVEDAPAAARPVLRPGDRRPRRRDRAVDDDTRRHFCIRHSPGGGRQPSRGSRHRVAR
ncbi:MAG: hypothetical protein HOY76_03355 [Streptomyces sp.]|nr:hypothetical protein [Streptomyces sp.]